MKRFLTILLISALPATAEVIGGLGGLGLDSEISKAEKEYSCQPLGGPEKPAQFSGSEGVPPLPLPAVPLRRTEKKSPPTPPVLIVKIRTAEESDWNTNPADVENLLRWMKKEMNVDFSSDIKTLEEVFRDGRRVLVAK